MAADAGSRHIRLTDLCLEMSSNDTIHRAQMDTSLRIETLKLADLPQIIHIEREAFADPWGEEVIRRKAGSSLEVFKVLKIGKKIVGFYCAEEKGNVALVSTIAVSPGYRGKSIGQRLLEDAVKHLKQASGKRILLHTRIDNEAMIRLAQKVGFRMVGIIPDFYHEQTRDAYEFEYSR